MIRFVVKTGTMGLLELRERLPVIIMLLWCSIAGAQPTPKDPMMLRIDSLNRLAYDRPAEISAACDSFIAIAVKNKNAKELGMLLMVRGVAETSMGNDDTALQNHMRSYRIFDSIKFTKGRIYSLCNIAATHLNIGNYTQARDYLNRALAITKKDDCNNLKTIYVNMGVTYEHQDNPEKAIEYYTKAIPCQEQMGDNFSLAVNYHNIGEVYQELGNYEKGKYYGLKAMEYQKKSGSRNALAMVSFSMADIYMHYKQYDKALQFLQEGHKAGLKVEAPYYNELYYEGMYHMYKEKGDYRKSIGYLEKLMLLRDTLHSEEKLKTNSTLEARFKSDLKTKEIELLKTQKKLDDSKIERTRMWWFVFFIISILCLIIIFILYRNYKLKQRANLVLGKEKMALEEQNLRLENENILVQFETLKNQVSPHFLFNSLNALVSLIKTDPDKALEFTAVFSKIFRNALELKDRHLITLKEELQHVDAYFYLQQMRFGESLVIQKVIPATTLNNYLPPFSLQMVVENAIKHNIVTVSRPLRITISVSGNVLTVANNLQPRQHVDDSTGTGIANIVSRYKYLNSQEPVFEVRNNQYIVELPLIIEE